MSSALSRAARGSGSGRGGCHLRFHGCFCGHLWGLGPSGLVGLSQVGLVTTLVFVPSHAKRTATSPDEYRPVMIMDKGDDDQYLLVNASYVPVAGLDTLFDYLL